ncbi:MAG: sigma-70 family RNA polymerase sigma factor [Sedimentisphaerales bacterium]|nr:sigma-70 family RNA polymerase sigma factor [Sedimentisphaerales bacterium]
MADFRCKNLGELLKQSKFAPEKQRLIQLNACETLIRIIRPHTEYPWEFVCFHITGYRPRNYALETRYSFNDLVNDLPIFAAELSRDMEITAEKYKGKTFTVETLAQKFDVCQKTINRWRSDGLIGRYMRFENGRKRLVFTAAGVEHYIKNHQGQVRRGRQFSQIDPQERRKIIKTLEKFSRFCPDRRTEAIRRTARRFRRSNESIRKILSDHERQIVKGRIFEKRSDFIKADQRMEIADLFARGVPVKELMAQFSRSKSNIYRALNIHWAQQLINTRIEYIPSKEFSDRSLKMEILNESGDLFESSEQIKPAPLEEESVNNSADATSKGSKEKPAGVMESYWQDIRTGQLLTQRQEAFLFRKYNYLKYLADELCRNINLKNPRGTQVRKAQQYLRQAELIKDWLIRSNLRLVVSVARKHTHRESELLELISEGNLAAMNAVEKFDYTRGFKFSTYATWAIVKRFATYRTKLSRRSSQIIQETEQEPLEVAQDLRVEPSIVVAVESARKSLFDVMRETLEQRERTIVQEHFGLDEQQKVPGLRKARSLSQIADMVGLSKERVRQIELLALQKLRKVLTPEQFEVITNG